MYPILFDKTEYKHTPAIAGIAVAGFSIVGDTTDVSDPFSTLGLGTLVDAITCTVTEERNGSYELQMTYPINGVHFEDIKQRCFILAKPNYLDDPQPFRIYKITKPMNGTCTIYARHISYDLSGFEVEGNLTAPSASLAFSLLDQRARGFNISGQVTGSSTFKTDVPSSVRSWFGGKQGSLIDLYGGEWKYDLYDCRLLANRGANRGVTIRYGKNLTTLTQDEECSNVYSHVRAYWKKGDDPTVYVSNLISTGMTLEPVRIFFLDCSGDFQDPPSVADLNARASAYITANNLDKPKVNLTLNFIQLQGIVDRVDLCDTVTIEFEQLGVSAQAKCIKTKWNVLKDVYDEISLGSAKSTLTETVSGISQGISNVKSDLIRTTNALVEAIDEATEMITGNLGGYVVLHDSDEDGFPDEILVMDEPSIEDAVNIWRWNKSGLGFSSTGYNGEFGLAMTANGQIVADFITTGTMSANRINGGTLALGGNDNQNGVLYVYDASGNLVGSWTKDGINVISGTIVGDLITAGKISSQNGSVYFDLDNNILQCTQLQGPYITNYPSGADAGNTRINIMRDRPNSYYRCFVHIYNTLVDTKGICLVPAGNDSSAIPIIAGDSGANEIDFRPILGDSSNNPIISLSKYQSSNSSATGLIFMQRKPNGSGIQILGDNKTHVVGQLVVSGQKSREIDTDSYGKQLLFAYETPTPLFGDVGEGEIGEDGLCYVWLEPIFASTINSDHYQVFLQKYGDGDCWIRERKADHFIVEGSPGLSFGWEIKAKQVDSTQIRLSNMHEYEVPSSQLGDMAVEYISELKEGRIA